MGLPQKKLSKENFVSEMRHARVSRHLSAGKARTFAFFSLLLDFPQIAETVPAVDRTKWYTSQLASIRRAQCPVSTGCQ